MNIIIVGAGEVGKHMAETLSGLQHNIRLIEQSEELITELKEGLDIGVIDGDGASAVTLAEADVGECDLFLALTSHDNTNLVAASVAKSLGAKKTVARVHASLQHGEWLFNYRDHFHIDYLFSTQRLAALELAKFVKNPDGLVVEEIARGRIELHQLVVSPDSEGIDVPLSQLNLPERVRIGAIRRGRETLIAHGDDALKAGDLVTLFGEPSRVGEIVHLLKPESKSEKDHKVVIFGGGEYGFALARLLEGGAFKVRIMEPSGRKCRLLSERLQNSVILNGDATSMHQLKEEQVGEADFFIAASSDDEDNVMACLQAKSLGVEYCLTLIHRADYADVIEANRDRLGFLSAVSPRLATMRDLLRFVHTEKYHKVMNLQGGLEVLQFRVSGTAEVVGQRVSSINWPTGSALVAILRDQEAFVPNGDDRLMAEDTVYAVVMKGAHGRMLELLTAS